MTTDASRPDFAAITGRQQQTWGLGDFNAIAMVTMPVAEALVAAANPHAGQNLLDVACGSGNVALVAGRRSCNVVGLDYVPALLERARQRAAADGVAVTFQTGDAQALPFPNASFDTVLSSFGVMFAPDQQKAADELLRVTKPGGTIGLANWMPEEYGGDFFRAIAKQMPPPAGVQPPSRWGTSQGLEQLLGPGTSSIQTERRAVTFYYRSIDHAWQMFGDYFGPIVRTLGMIEPAQREQLKQDVCAVFAKYNRSSDGTTAIFAEYLQVIAKVK